MKKKLSLLIVLFVYSISYTQDINNATLLVLSNLDGKIIFDGDEIGECRANIPYKFNSNLGEHYLQIQAKQNGVILDKGEIITITDTKQKIIKLLFELDENNLNGRPEAINVCNTNFSLNGEMAKIAWENENKNIKFPEQEFYFAFEKGDEINLNLNMSNEKGTNFITINKYPSNITIYSNKSFQEIKDLKLKINERCILRFIIGTNHAFNRNAFLKIDRFPSSKNTIPFNTNVTKKKIYSPITIINKENFYINSGSNASFKGGKSRIIVPINLPDNTVEWYYKYSGTRSSDEVSKVKQSFNLFGELSKLIDNISPIGLTTNIAINQLSQPPGSDVCDIYLLDYNNINPFLEKTNFSYILQGTRENLNSGNVKIVNSKQNQLYLGIKNPDSFYGINVLLEVVAITASEDFVMEEN